MKSWTCCFPALLLAGCLLNSSVGSAQETPKESGNKLPLTAAMRSEVIAGALKQLRENYVYPEVAKKMEAAIQKRVENKEYDSITDGFQFAEMLTTHLREISHDKHLRIRCSAAPLPERIETPTSPQEREKERDFLRRVNFGFEKVERMPGNIGYLDMRFFAQPDLAGETFAAAMSFLASTDALILDLRQNGGGDPAMVQFVCSYFFGGEPVHLNDLYWRPSDTTQQFWTLPYVPGKRYVDKEVYVLTSRQTFSGAEECAYNLKNLKRATLIGETTGGGAHPGGAQRINAHFMVWVPSGRAINPITKDNWEGKGVVPDVAVPADKALKKAHLMALRKQLERTQDEEFKKRLQELSTQLQKELAANRRVSAERAL